MAKADQKSTEVATIDDAGGVPAYLQGGSYQNDDNFDSSDVVIPRIKLLQGTSPEVDEYDEAKTGMFWHTGLDVPLGDEFRFIVADRRKKVLLMPPINDANYSGPLARADDAKTWDQKGEWQVRIKNVKQPVTWRIDDLDVEKSGLLKFGSSIPDDEDSPPAATLFYDYLVYLPDHPDMGMVVMSLARTQIKKAKRGLNDKIKMHADNGRPMQALIFKAKSVDDSADGQDFKNLMFMSAGFVQDEALFNQLREYRGALSNLKIQDEGDHGGKDPEGDSHEGDF